MRKKIIIILTIIFITILIIVLRLNLANNSQKLSANTNISSSKIHFLYTDSHNISFSSESILIESNGKYGLIDAGNPNDSPYTSSNAPFNGETIAKYLDSIGVNRLDFILITHGHSDHLGGIPYLAANGYVDKDTTFIYREYTSGLVNEEIQWNTQYFFDEAKNAMINKNAKMFEISDHSDSNLSKINASFKDNGGDSTDYITFIFGEFNIKIFNIRNFNNIDHEDKKSLVILLTKDDKKTLLLSEVTNNDNIINQIANYVGKVDLAKIGHYDTLGHMTLRFLNVTNPTNAIITGSLTDSSLFKSDSGYILAFFNETGNFLMGNEDSNYPIVAVFDNNIKLYSNNNGQYDEIKSINISAKPKIGWYEIIDTKKWNIESEIVYVYIDSDYKLAKGLKKIDNKYYYFQETSTDSVSAGVMLTGWQKIDDNWYYFSDGTIDNYIMGSMVYNTSITINNKTYIFDENGICTNYNSNERIAQIPTNSICLPRIYTGLSQQLTSVISGEGYTLSDYSQVNAGNHIITAALLNGYKWNDNTTETKTINCSIEKAIPTIMLSDAYTEVDVGSTITFNEKANVKGKFTVTSNNTNIATVTQASSNEIAANTNNKVTVTAKKAGTANITINFTPADTTNYKNALNKTILITVNETIKIVQIPTASAYCNSLTYTGSSQTLVKTAGDGYTWTSGTTRTEAGSQTVTATLKSGYKWSDNSTGTKTINCSIEKAIPTIMLSDAYTEVDVGSTITFNEKANVKGKFTVTSNNTNIATVSQVSNEEIDENTNNKVIVTGISSGSAIITINFIPTDTNNYNNSETITFTVIVNETSIDISKLDIRDNNVIFDKTITLNELKTIINSNNVELKDKNGNIKISNRIGTNDKIVMSEKTYDVVVLGDLDGDGEVKFNDLIKSYRYYRKKIIPNELELIASDVVNDNNIKFNDVIKIYRMYRKK